MTKSEMTQYFESSNYVFTTKEEYEAWIERMRENFDEEEALRYGYDPEVLRKQLEV